MTEFFDWLTAADSGLGTDRLRERFRLSQDEMQRTTEALAPAFLIGLQRLMSDAGAWADFNRRLAAFAPSGTDPASAITAKPNAFLADFFGTKALAESVSRQASLMAGVSPDTIAKMMPDFGLMTLRAAMMMAGASAGGAASPSDAAGQATAEWMRRSANAVEAFSRPSSTGSSAQPRTDLHSMFADALAGGFPWMRPPAAAASSRRTTRTAETGTDALPFPFLAFQPFLGSAPAKAEADAKAALPADAPEGSRVQRPLDAMEQAAAAALTLQETYAREMISLFDRHRRTD